jgi:uncharacterized membrane protein YdfJ with MMPL/SSD domain
VAAVLTLALTIFGVPTAKSLSPSGFEDPTSQSFRATQLLTEKFGQGDVQMLIAVSTPDGVNSPAARTAGTEIVEQLSRSPHVVSGVLVGRPSAPTGEAQGSAFLTVDSTAPLFSDRSETQLDRLHAVPAPAGVETDFTGLAQISCSCCCSC